LASPSGKNAVYQLKVTLKHIRPPIWRRVLVPAEMSLADLHDVIQMAMGWCDGHLHAFRAGGREYSLPDPINDDLFGAPEIDERSAVLRAVARHEKDKLTYEYDFGDGWEHEVVVEKILPREQGKDYPVCVTGRRACPPEDCGGPWGYGAFLEAIANPHHPDHKEMTEWIGDDFDPGAFDLQAVNERLAALKLGRRRRPRRDIFTE